ncbi:MAG: polysaccharide biosynthesis C-terminal domain-containing protein, partial [Candidatus Levyibacteriota bacterium]
VLTWVLTILFIRWFGYNGVALASFIVSASVLLILIPVKKELQFSFVGPIWKQFLASLLMGILVYASSGMIHSLVELGVMMILAGIFYLGILFAISKNELMKIYAFISDIIKKDKK